MPNKYPNSPEIATPDFAAQAAQDGFGKHYVHPLDRNFQDHRPNWQRLDQVAQSIVERTAPGCRHE